LTGRESVLAYVFWHRPVSSSRREEYEGRLTEFHEALRGALLASAAYRLERLPFTRGAGYEDWYLVESWAALGALNEAALRGRRERAHEAVATLSGEGWGGVYGLVRGTPIAPEGVGWTERQEGESYDSFLARVSTQTVWQRQLVLGPAPEFCLGAESSEGRVRVWPP
jgi:hypothetical protein